MKQITGLTFFNCYIQPQLNLQLVEGRQYLEEEIEHNLDISFSVISTE